MYADGGGLYLQVSKTGASWIYRFMLNKRAREMGLGPLSLYGLAEARAMALDARRLRHQGIDPIEARSAVKAKERIDAAKAVTFQECADSYIKAHSAGWGNKKHAAQWDATLSTYAKPIVGSLPVSAIDTTLVLKILQQHVEAKRGEPEGELWQARPETAARLRGRIEAILDWAKVRDYRTGENPARWKGHLDHLLPSRGKVRKIEHHAALPHPELPAFLAELREQQGIAARALEFSILTATRRGEVLGAQWSEFNLLDKTWTVPAERMKAGKEHRIPLSARALVILQEMQALRRDVNARVFDIGERGMLDALQALRPECTMHGFRSSFRDWAAERTNYPNHVVEQALAHSIGNAVEAAYRRGDLFDKRRKLMDAWAAFCSSPVEIGNVVVPMRA